MKKNLVWYEKRKNTSISSNCDISITVVTYKSNEKPVISFVFRRGIDDLFNTTGYIRFALDGDKLYFCECTKNKGYIVKARSNKGKVGPNKYCTCSNSYLAELLKNRRGDYVLQYDKEQELYYVKTVVSEG